MKKSSFVQSVDVGYAGDRVNLYEYLHEDEDEDANRK